MQLLIFHLVLGVLRGVLRRGEERRYPQSAKIIRTHAKPGHKTGERTIYNSIEHLLIDNIWCLSIGLSREENLDTIFGSATG